jgi:hypothetical protein
MRKLASLPVVLLSVVLLAGCPSSEEDEDPPSPAFVPITSASSAGLVAGAIADAVAAVVPSGTYSNTVVNGSSGGSAIVSGSESFSGSQSCGSGCVTSSNSANLIITFNNYFVRPGNSTNTRVRITGSVTFTDNRSTTQNGFSFSSSGQMRVTANSALTVLLEIVDGTGTYGYEDTLSSLTAFGTGTTWDGTLRPANGTTYSF